MNEQNEIATGDAGRPRGNEGDSVYDAFLVRLNTRFLENVEQGKRPLFTTDAAGLWEAYLDGFADEPLERQYHTCHACRQFVERFGGLVTIDAAGRTASAVWDEDDAPLIYRPAVAAMAKLVRRAKVTGVFLSSDRVWGTPVTGPWRHWSVRPEASMVYRKRPTKTAGQAMAEKREDYGQVCRALAEIQPAHLETAVTLLQTDALYRTEKVLGQAEWLRELLTARDAAHGSQRGNVVWRAVATAPAGFCHPRASMINTLLEDIAAGLSYETVARRFAEKMHPLAYQRPQAAPTAGAIAAAEKTIAALGAQGSLARRFARVDELTALWRPPVILRKREGAEGSVFGHLAPKGSAPVSSLIIPSQLMTWEKFERTVLPAAEKIELYVGGGRLNFVTFTTAVNAEAPPILQWDREDARNPVAWYVWNGGSPSVQFGLPGGRYQPVGAVVLKPSAWNLVEGQTDHHGDTVVFVVEGAKESRNAGAAIFPETLKSEYHGIRSVIEAYSASAKIEGMGEPHAAGLGYTKGRATNWDARLRVTAGGRTLDYKLDRWD